MSDICYCPYFIDKETLQRFLPQLKRLQQGERAGLRLEKLEGLPVYAIRLNKADRLLLVRRTINSKSHWVVLEYVPNHRYDKARCLDKKMFHQLFDEKWAEHLQTLSEDDFQQCDETLSINAINKQVHFFNQAPLIYTDEQEKALTIALPALIVGQPGSGKTTTGVLGMLEHFFHQNPDETMPVLVVAPNSKLINHMRTHWQQQACYPVDQVIFQTYNDLLDIEQDYLSEHEFKTWFIATCKGMEKKSRKMGGLSNEYRQLITQAHNARFEFGLIATHGSSEYKRLGGHQSTFSASYRKALIQLYDVYTRHLASINKQDIQLIRPKAHSSYALVIVDEAQHFAPVQLEVLFSLSKQAMTQPLNASDVVDIPAENQSLLPEPSQAAYPFLACMDREQCLLTAPWIENFLQQLFWRHGQTYTEPFILSKSWRCTQEVAALANAILHAKHTIEGKSSHHYRQIESALTVPGNCLWFDDINDANQDALQKLCQSANTLVITDTSLNSKEAIRKLTTSTQILDPQDTLSFEYNTVVLMHPFKNQTAHNITEFNSQLEHFFNALFVSITRARFQVIVIQPSHHKIEPLLNIIRPFCSHNPSADCILLDKASSTPEAWQKRCDDFLDMQLYDTAKYIMVHNLGRTPEEADKEIEQAFHSPIDNAGNHQSSKEHKKEIVLSFETDINQLVKWFGSSSDIEAILLNNAEQTNANNASICLATSQSAAPILHTIKKNHAALDFFIANIFADCFSINDNKLNLMQLLAYHQNGHALLFHLLPYCFKSAPTNFYDKAGKCLMKKILSSDSGCSELLLFKLYEGVNTKPSLNLFLSIFKSLNVQDKIEALTMVHNQKSAGHGDTLAFALHQHEMGNFLLAKSQFHLIDNWDFAWLKPTNIQHGTAPLFFYLLRSAIYSTEENNIRRILSHDKQLFHSFIKHPEQLIELIITDKGDKTSLLGLLCETRWGNYILNSILVTISKNLVVLCLEKNVAQFGQALLGFHPPHSKVRPLWHMLDNQLGIQIIKDLIGLCPDLIKYIQPVVESEGEAFRGKMQQNMRMNFKTEQVLQLLQNPSHPVFRRKYDHYLPVLRQLKEQINHDESSKDMEYYFLYNQQHQEDEIIRKKLSQLLEGFKLDAGMIDQLIGSFYVMLQMEQHAIVRYTLSNKNLRLIDATQILASFLVNQCENSWEKQAVEIITGLEPGGERNYFIVLNRDVDEPIDSIISYQYATVIDVQKEHVKYMSLPYLYEHSDNNYNPIKAVFGIDTPGSQLKLHWSHCSLWHYFNNNLDLGDKTGKAAVLSCIEPLINRSAYSKHLNVLLHRNNFVADHQLSHRIYFSHPLLDKTLQAKLIQSIEIYDIEELEGLFLKPDNQYGSLLAFYLTQKDRVTPFFKLVQSNEKLHHLLVFWLQKSCVTAKGANHLVLDLLVKHPKGARWLSSLIEQNKNNVFFLHHLRALLITPIVVDKKEIRSPLHCWMQTLLYNKMSDAVFTQLFLKSQPFELRNALTSVVCKLDSSGNRALMQVLDNQSRVTFKFTTGNIHLIDNWSFAWCFDTTNNLYRAPYIIKMLLDPELDVFFYNADDALMDKIFEPAIQDIRLLFQRYPIDFKGSTTILELLLAKQSKNFLFNYLCHKIPMIYDHITCRVLLSEQQVSGPEDLKRTLFWLLLNYDHGMKLLFQIQKYHPDQLLPVVEILKNSSSGNKSLSHLPIHLRDTLLINIDTRQLSRKMGLLPAIVKHRLHVQSVKDWFTAIEPYKAQQTSLNSRDFVEHYMHKLNKLIAPLTQYGFDHRFQAKLLYDEITHYSQMLSNTFFMCLHYKHKKLDTNDLALLCALSIQQQLYKKNTIDAPVAAIKLSMANDETSASRHFVILNYHSVLTAPYSDVFLYPDCQVIDVLNETVMSGYDFNMNYIVAKLPEHPDIKITWSSWQGVDKIVGLYDLILRKNLSRKGRASLITARENILQLFEQLLDELEKLQIPLFKTIPCDSDIGSHTRHQHGLFSRSLTSDSQLPEESTDQEQSKVLSTSS